MGTIRSAAWLAFLAFLGILSVSAQSGLDPYHYKVQKVVRCSHGAVVSAHPLASKVGLNILKAGGNAVDAAIATQLALAVVYPGAGNLGGGGFFVACLSGDRKVTLDFREKAPGRATKTMYLDSTGSAQLERSQDGHLACGVPGTVAGIFSELKYSRFPITRLIAPAIELAENGFAITAGEAEALNETREEFIKLNTRPTAFVRERPWKAGDTLVQKELAETLRRIAREGRRGFYEGETARLIVEEMQRGGGIIGYDDLRNYQAKERPPVVIPYKNDYQIVTMPLPSSGGVLLPQMLRMVEDRPLSQYGFHTLRSVQLMTEVERLSYADRAAYLGDVDYFKVPVKTLISYPYVKERMKLYHPDSAGNSLRIHAGVITAPEHEETTHLDVCDEQGNVVAITTTLNGGFGSRTVVGGAGFLLNNEMDDFSVKPGVPNMYGAVGGEANAIEAGKRMLSSMTPTVVLRHGTPYLVVGTPGGTTITTSVFQTLVNILDFNLSTENAVNEPKFHHQWLPDVLYIEKGFPKTVIQQLQQMGYTIKEREAIGRTEVIKISGKGQIEAVGDRRGDDSAEGF